jgi:hypothetical protein
MGGRCCRELKLVVRVSCRESTELCIVKILVKLPGWPEKRTLMNPKLI